MCFAVSGPPVKAILSTRSSGGVPRTSTLALNNATLPFLVKLANKGYQKALGEDKHFLAGLNVHKGHVTYKAVADVFGHSFVEPGEAIKN